MQISHLANFILYLHSEINVLHVNMWKCTPKHWWYIWGVLGRCFAGKKKERQVDDDGTWETYIWHIWRSKRVFVSQLASPSPSTFGPFQQKKRPARQGFLPPQKPHLAWCVNGARSQAYGLSDKFTRDLPGWKRGVWGRFTHGGSLFWGGQKKGDPLILTHKT